MESATPSAAETAPPLAAETVDLAGELTASALLGSAPLRLCEPVPPPADFGERESELGHLAHLRFILLGRL